MKKVASCEKFSQKNSHLFKKIFTVFWNLQKLSLFFLHTRYENRRKFRQLRKIYITTFAF